MASTSTETSGLDTATQQKIDTAKQSKDEGDQAFKDGHLTSALRCYHTSLLYVLGIDKNAFKSMTSGAPDPVKEGEEKKQEKTEVDEIVEKIYANMAICHIKNENWQRALDCADKALAKNENNYKAMFRKGKALGEQGFYERAEMVLKELKKKHPEGLTTMFIILMFLIVPIIHRYCYC